MEQIKQTRGKEGVGDKRLHHNHPLMRHKNKPWDLCFRMEGIIRSHNPLILSFSTLLFSFHVPLPPFCFPECFSLSPKDWNAGIQVARLHKHTHTHTNNASIRTLATVRVGMRFMCKNTPQRRNKPSVKWLL